MEAQKIYCENNLLKNKPRSFPAIVAPTLKLKKKKIYETKIIYRYTWFIFIYMHIT